MPRTSCTSPTSHALLCFCTQTFSPVIRLEEWIRLDGVRRKDFIDEAIACDLADAHVFVQMLVVAINLDRAFRCIEADAASRRTNLVDIKAASFLDGSLPEVNGVVSGFNRIIRDAVFAVCFLIGRDELLVSRRLGRLVIVPRDEVASDVLGTDAL